MDEITVITLNNEFDRTDRDTQLVPYQGTSLLTLRDTILPKGIHSVASVNGQIISEEQLALTVTQKGDSTVFSIKVREFISGAVAAWALAYLALATTLTATTIAVISLVVELVVYLACMVALYGAGMLVSSLFAPSPPDVNTGGGMDASQIYSWSPTTTNKQGGMIPRMYGESRAVGNAIAVYTETVSDKSYLNISIS